MEATRTLPANRARRIIIRGGDYWDVAIVLDPRDSGLTIQAAPGEEAVLFGGHRLTGFHSEAGGVLLVANLPFTDAARPDS